MDFLWNSLVSSPVTGGVGGKQQFFSLFPFDIQTERKGNNLSTKPMYKSKL